jgi:hypothetical protein
VSAQDSSPASSHIIGRVLYRAAKYLIYGLLTVNVGLFLQEEMLSAQHALNSGSNLSSLIQLFSATLDTAAWVILLLLFELETAVIPDEKLVGKTKWLIHGVRFLCGAAIVSACLGYIGEWEVFLVSAPAPSNPCELVDGRWSVLLDFDDFTPLTPENCLALGDNAVQATGLSYVLATPAAFESAYDLALVDVVNASAWILVVILLEIEVRLQLRGGVPGQFQWLMNGFKVVLYTTLALAAVYWGFEGEFLDFWDAALWLFAFVFIELNVFAWQQELKTQGEASS